MKKAAQMTVKNRKMFLSKMKWPPSYPKSVAITQSIGRMMAMNLLPHNFVEGNGFK